MFNNKSKKQENFLLYIPVKNHKTFEEKNNRVYLIFHHDKLVEKITRKLFKKPAITDIELDELGSEVWRLIDGNKNILQIIERMKEKFGQKCEPINERLILFIRYLNKRNWINFKKSI